jgi:hypothetical protein
VGRRSHRIGTRTSSTSKISASTPRNGRPSENPRLTCQAATSQPGEHGEGERDAPRRDDVEVALLGEPPRCVSEGDRGHGGAGAARAELPYQGVGADQQQRVGQHEKNVVAERGGERTVAEHAGRCVAEQTVAEREAVRLREERVRLPELGRVGEQDVPAPSDLPGLAGRVAEILRQGVQRVLQGGPGHRHSEGDRDVRDQGVLVDQAAADGADGPADAAGRALRGGGEDRPGVARGGRWALAGQRLLEADGRGRLHWTVWRNCRGSGHIGRRWAGGADGDELADGCGRPSPTSDA